MAAKLPVTFDFLLLLVDAGLGHSSLCAFLAAISAFHDPIDGYLVFSTPFLNVSIKDFYVKRPPAAWDLSLVFRRVTQRPFM